MTVFIVKLKKLKPLYDISYKVLMFICKLLLIADILITAWAVAGRYLPFVKDPSWSEEIVLTLMVYLAVLSASLAIRKGAHIRMTAFDKALSRKGILITDIISDILVFALGIVMTVCGIKLLNSPLCTLGRYASIPKLSKFWQYFPVTIAGLSMMIFELEQLFLHIEKLYIPESGEVAEK